MRAVVLADGAVIEGSPLSLPSATAAGIPFRCCMRVAFPLTPNPSRWACESSIRKAGGQDAVWQMGRA